MNVSALSIGPRSIETSAPSARRRDLSHSAGMQASQPSNEFKVSTSNATLGHQKFSAFSQHCISTSTSPTDSIDSSPLTPHSINDDAGVTDMSSDLSPLTVSSLPHKALIPSSPDGSIEVSPCTPDRDESIRLATSQDTTNQANGRKRPKNLKNLAVKTAAGSASLTRPLASATAPGFSLAPPVQVNSPVSSASTLSVASTARTARRRPSNLSVITATTSGSTDGSAAFSGTPQNVATPIVLPRPNILRHFQSSPALPLCETESPSIKAESAAPLTNHMRPILERSHSATSPIREDDFADYDLPLSREEKAEAYPDGPICIYEPNLDLYLEPTAKIASCYDVVINVASEVRNPFLPADRSQPLVEQGLRIDGGGGIQFAPRRGRDPNEEKRLTAEVPDSSKSTSDSNEGGQRPALKEPEYIHIPWEHNSDIVPELPALVRLIDDRIMRGKRVLVHCQCGVSRSATLVVAYCMYKRPSATVQEAYDEVKKRSKWIGPNMNLIMQLQEFRSNLMGKATSRRLTGFRGISPIDRASPKKWMPQRPAIHVDFTYNEAAQPKTAPLQPGPSPQEGLEEHIGSAVTSGPSSAPSGVSWPITGDSEVHESASRTASVPSCQNGTPWDDKDDDSDRTPKRRPQSSRFERGDQANLVDSGSPVTPRSTNPGTAARSAQNFSLPLRRYADDEPISPTKLVSPARSNGTAERIGQIAGVR